MCIRDRNNADVIDDSEVYPGRWARATIQPFYYDTDGNRGISFGLENVQLLRNDEPIGGGSRAKPTDEFAPVDTGDSSGAGLFD